LLDSAGQKPEIEGIDLRLCASLPPFGSMIGSKSIVEGTSVLKSCGAGPASMENRPALRNIGTIRGSPICLVSSRRPDGVPPAASEACTPRR
jgi:hypothetical protein